MSSQSADTDGARKQRWWFGMSPVSLMGVLAAIVFAAVISAAAAMVALEANTGTQKRLTPCEYEALGYSAELGVKPWSLESSGCMGMIYLSALFLLRSQVFPAVVEVLCPRHTAAKKEKVANYMLEILLCTTGLIVISVGGFWDLLFHPPKTNSPDPETANRIAVTTFLSFQLSICTYILELSFDRAMRLELKVHHYLGVYLGIHGILALGPIGGNLYMARLCLGFPLFIFTEGPVFVMLFLYQVKFYQWVFYELIGYYYIISRLLVIAVIYWAWWDVRESVFEIYDHNSVIVYGIFLVVPIGVLFLLITQLTAAVNLFGISRRVRGLRRQGQVHARLSKLFTDMADSNDTGSLSLEEWMAKVGNVVDAAAAPQGGLAAIFHRMDTQHRGVVEVAEFVAFFSPLAINTSEDAALLRAMLLLALLEEESDGEGSCEAARAELRAALAPVLAASGGGRGCGLTVDQYIEKKLAEARKQRRSEK